MSAPAGSASRLCVTGTAAELAAAAERAGSPLAHRLVAVAVVSLDDQPADRGIIESARMGADRHDVAFLITDDAVLASEVGADGVEIDWSLEAFRQARDLLGADRSVGCRIGISRHHAMEAAEANADFIHIVAQGPSRGDIDAMIEMAEWWSEIFEIPCVASGTSDIADVARLAAADVDFIAVDVRFLMEHAGAVFHAIEQGAEPAP